MPNDLYDQCSYNQKNVNKIEIKNDTNDDDEGNDDDDLKSCPFSGLPATHLQIKKCQKIGFLFRIEKRIFFNISKKFYAGILNGWLILYNSHTDLRPTMCLQLSKCNLDLVNGGGDQLTNKRNSILQFSSNGKKYQFQAITLIETDDWINAIENEIKNKNRSLPEPPQLTVKPSSPEPPNRNSEEIYEEPSEIEQLPDEKLALTLDYDVPKSPPRSINDAPLPVQSSHVDRQPKIDGKLSATVATTPINHQKSFSKHWLFNRLSRSTSGSASTSPKSIKAKLISPESPTISVGSSNAAITSHHHHQASIKGHKVNQIINQLEANGSLSLLSKSMFATEKHKSFLLNNSQNYDEHNYEPVCLTPSKIH